MVEEMLCINSDAVNRYGFRMHITGMEKSLKDVYNNGMPLLIGHDFHRPIGWALPFGIFIEPKLGRMIAKKMIATNSREQDFINREVQRFLSKRYDEHFDPYETDFFKVLGSHLDSAYEKIDCGCIAIIQNGIVKKLFAHLFNEMDKAGLIPLSTVLMDFDYIRQGIFKHKTSSLCIFAHRYLRRSQSRFNNFFFQFIDELLLLKDNTDVTVRIRIDNDMVGYAPSNHAVGELEYHWGPKYTDDISQIKIGLCRHECSDTDRHFYGISATEFYWKKDEAEITFEMEELRDTPSPASDEIYHCRYLHSIYNTDCKEFIHFDGAMRSYDFDAMNDRVSKNFLEYGRKAIYKKIFRIDGKLPLNKWKLLVTHYYQENPLIYEYFGLAEERNLLKPQSVELNTMQKLLPYVISKEEGLRIFVSYHNIPDDLKLGRYIDILDVMSSGDKKTYCLEYTIHEVKIALQRIGCDLEIPPGIDLIRLDDEYWNIPSIMHNGEDIPGMLQKTVEAFLLLFSAMDKHKFEKRISLTLSFIFNNRVIRISSYGHLQNQIAWLKDNFPFPATEVGVTEWVSKQSDYLDQFTANKNNYLLDSLLQNDGVLFIKRIPVLFPYDYSFDKNEQLKFTITFPKKEDDTDGVFEMISENKIRIIMAIAVESIIWEDTREDYYTSSRSKWIDDDSSFVLIDQCSPLALYWASTAY